MDYNISALLNEEMLIVITALMIGLFLFLAFFVNSYLPFKEERDYIKMEIASSIEEAEYLYWKSELKMLYISKIPIVSSIVRRKYNR